MNRPGNEKYLHGADAWLSKDDATALGMHVQPAGTIVFPKRGGAIATNKKRRLAVSSCYDLNCMGLIPIPTVSEFIWWWFASINLGTLSDGANIPQVNHGDIEPLVVPLPPLKEQSRIVTEVEARLSVVEATEFAIASNETRAAHLRRAVLKVAFEGALVPQDPHDEPASKLLERISASAETSPLLKQGRAKQTTAVPKTKATR
jgi:type I restriction enzyme S subunit